MALQNITISLIFHERQTRGEWETCWLIIFLVRSSRFIIVALSPLLPLISYSKSFVVQIGWSGGYESDRPSFVSQRGMIIIIQCK